MAGRRAGTGEGSGQLLATLQTMAESLARIEAAVDRMGAPSGGIDHDDAKALKTMADAQYTDHIVWHESTTQHADGRIETRKAGRAEGGADPATDPPTDEPEPTVDKAPESGGERRPWWLKPW